MKQARNRRADVASSRIEGVAARPARSSFSPFVAAGAAIVAATVTAAASPVAPAALHAQPTETALRVSSEMVALTAASSPFNIPVNLLIDVINIPNREREALQYEGAAFLYGGSWWVSMATNVWGTDPADPPKYMGGAMLALPFPHVGETVGKLLTALAIVQLPVNQACGTTSCTDPMPLLANFFTVALPALFPGDPDAPGFYLDPEAPGQQSFGGFVPTDPFGPGFGHAGTIDDPSGKIDPLTGEVRQLQPWAGQSINLTRVIRDGYNDYLEHLMQDPAQNEIKFPTGIEAQRALTNLFAGFIVAFNPITPGTSYFPSTVFPRELTPEGIVDSLVKADPGNTLLANFARNHAWQQSQGAPGTPIPTPSTKASVEAGMGRDTQPVNPAPMPTPNPFLQPSTDPMITGEQQALSVLRSAPEVSETAPATETVTETKTAVVTEPVTETATEKEPVTEKETVTDKEPVTEKETVTDDKETATGTGSVGGRITVSGRVDADSDSTATTSGNSTSAGGSASGSSTLGGGSTAGSGSTGGAAGARGDAASGGEGAGSVGEAGSTSGGSASGSSGTGSE